jgi:ABC-type uncharacterized transport system YnjBCD permease subunit
MVIGHRRLYHIIALTTLGLGLAVMVAVSYLGMRGLRRLEPQGIVRWAHARWRQGDFAGAALGVGRAAWMSLEAEARWRLADVFLNRSHALVAARHLPEALGDCTLAVRILGRYDTAGARAYYCMAIEHEMKYRATSVPASGSAP